MGEGDEREGAAYLEDASNNNDNEIYGAIASGQGTTTNAKDDANYDDDKEGLMVGIPQFWVCAMGHMEAVAELITERYIEFVENLSGVTCQDFEDSSGFELRFTFDIKTNGFFYG